MKAILITSGQRLNVTVTETAQGTLVIREGSRILFGLKPAKEATGNITSQAAPPTTQMTSPARLNPRAPSWEWLTPEVVIEYFRHSSVLSYLADDVTARLKDEAAADVGRAADQLSADLVAIEPYLDNIIRDDRFVYGYQSRIAEALRVPNEGGYRRRIKNVAAVLARRLDSTSTNTQTGREFDKKRRTA